MTAWDLIRIQAEEGARGAGGVAGGTGGAGGGGEALLLALLRSWIATTGASTSSFPPRRLS